MILISDMGSDVDDFLALLNILHLPKNKVECLGIVVCYGQTKIR